MNIGTTLLRDLPVYSGALDDNTTVVAVVGNRTAYRVGMESLAGSYVTWTSVLPAGPETPSTSSRTMAWSPAGAFLSSDSGWLKVPVYGDHWGDLGETTRFLRVDEPMELSGAEVSNALESLGVTGASRDAYGMVRVSDTVEGGGDRVPTSSAVEAYVGTKTAGVDAIYSCVYAMKVCTEDMSSSAVASAELACNMARQACTGAYSAMAHAAQARDSWMRAASYKEEACAAARTAVEASGAFDGYDDVPTEGSTRAARSGGIYEWTKGNFASTRALELHAGDAQAHVSEGDRARWDSFDPECHWGTQELRCTLSRLSGGHLYGEYTVTVTADCSEVLSAGACNSVQYARLATLRSGSLCIGSERLDSLQVEAGTISFRSQARMDVNGFGVLTDEDMGTFGGSDVPMKDGLATVRSVASYVDSSRSAVVDLVASRYVPNTAHVAYTDECNVFTESNVFSGANNFTGNNAFSGDNTFTGVNSIQYARIGIAAAARVGVTCYLGVGGYVSMSPNSADMRGEDRLVNVDGALYWGARRLDAGSGGGTVSLVAGKGIKLDEGSSGTVVSAVYEGTDTISFDRGTDMGGNNTWYYGSSLPAGLDLHSTRMTVAVQTIAGVSAAFYGYLVQGTGTTSGRIVARAVAPFTPSAAGTYTHVFEGAVLDADKPVVYAMSKTNIQGDTFTPNGQVKMMLYPMAGAYALSSDSGRETREGYTVTRSIVLERLDSLGDHAANDARHLRASDRAAIASVQEKVDGIYTGTHTYASDNTYDGTSRFNATACFTCTTVFAGPVGFHHVPRLLNAGGLQFTDGAGMSGYLSVYRSTQDDGGILRLRMCGRTVSYVEDIGSSVVKKVTGADNVFTGTNTFRGSLSFSNATGNAVTLSCTVSCNLVAGAVSVNSVNATCAVSCSLATGIVTANSTSFTYATACALSAGSGEFLYVDTWSLIIKEPGGADAGTLKLVNGNLYFKTQKLTNF